MKLRLFAIVLGLPLLAEAGVTTSSVALAGENQKSAPAASITQRADYLCAVVVIRSSVKEIDRQTAAVQLSVTALRNAAERSTRFQLHDGPVQSTSDLPQPGVTGGVLQATVRVLFPLANSSPVEMVGNMRLLRQFVAAVDTTGGATLEISSITLAVEAPEQYRDKLLDLIADQTRIAQRSLEARTITVEGLGNGISVRQLDEMNVEIYIEHQISASVTR